MMNELLVFILRLFGIMIGGIVLLSVSVEGGHQIQRPAWNVPWGLRRFAVALSAWWVLYLATVENASVLLANGNRLAGGGLSEALISLLGYLLGVGMPTLAVLHLFVWWPFAGRLERLFQADLVAGWVREGVCGYLACLPLLTLPWLFNLLGPGRSTGMLLLAAAIPHALGDQAISLVSVALVAPIVEETLFRGFVYASLASWQDWRVALIFSSALFALAHRNVFEFWPLFVMGLACGLVYERTRSLASSVLLHSLSNLASFATLLLLEG